MLEILACKAHTHIITIHHEKCHLECTSTLCQLAVATTAPLAAAATAAAAASLLAHGTRLGGVVRIQGLRGAPGGHAAATATMLLSGGLWQWHLAVHNLH